MSDFINEIIRMKEWIENDIQAMKGTIQIQEDHVLLLNKFINSHCNHSWEKDYIDLDVDKSKIIQYCKKCRITKTEKLN